MGTVNYCKDFIRNLAIIADPLYRLTKKNSAFTWDTEAQSAFDQVKSAVANAVSLNLPDTKYPFYLECVRKGSLFVKSLEMHHFTIFGFKVIIKTDHNNI